ncbi:MAG: glycosyltransferase family 39 protein [Spirochaetales bacterium]|nr:glycosyltransferase family 39 protein [Spirochaetales bacterium]
MYLFYIGLIILGLAAAFILVDPLKIFRRKEKQEKPVLINDLPAGKKNDRIKIGLDIFMIVYILFLLLISLNSFPRDFIYCEADAARQPVEKVFDNMESHPEIGWLWQDMNQAGVGKSPVYSFFVEIGLRLFGFTLFGLRIFPVLFACGNLILFYFILKRYFDIRIVYPFFLLLVSSPWYLLITRSATGVGFGMSLIIFSLSMLVLFHKSKSWVVVPVLTGISIALLPYGYANAKHLPVLFILWILINIKKLKVRRVLTVLAAILVCIIPQFFDLRKALYNYNRSDGETLTYCWQYEKDPIGFIFERVSSNLLLQIRTLLGITDEPGTWNEMVVQTLYKRSDLYYPRFLVPFFVFGFIYSGYRFFRLKKKHEGAIFLFFLASFVPGLASGLGNPNPGRDYLMVLPLYYYIALSFSFLFETILMADSEIPQLKFKFLKLNLIQLPLLVLFFLLFLFTEIFQPCNYFGYKDRQYDYVQATNVNNLYKYMNEQIERDSSSSFLFYYPDRILGIYTALRFSHPKQIRNFIENGQLHFHYWKDLENNISLLKSGEIKYIISFSGFKQAIINVYTLYDNEIIYSGNNLIVLSAAVN